MDKLFMYLRLQKFKEINNGHLLYRSVKYKNEFYKHDVFFFEII